VKKAKRHGRATARAPRGAAARAKPARRARGRSTPPARTNAPRANPVASGHRPAPRRRATSGANTAALRAIVVRGDKIAAATRLMAETLPLAGYTNILADCPGKRRPHLIRGMRADHRPNLVCQGGYRYVLMDVVFPGEMHLPDIASRWQLFSSAAEQAGGEFHVVVPRWVDGVGAGRDAITKAADAIGIRISHIWEF
jgi:hypothetical protein